MHKTLSGVDQVDKQRVLSYSAKTSVCPLKMNNERAKTQMKNVSHTSLLQDLVMATNCMSFKGNDTDIWWVEVLEL